MKVVQFVKPFSVYAPGDVAGLPEAEAKAAFEAEAAVPYKNGKKSEETETEDTERKTIDSPVTDKMVKNPTVKK